MIKGKGIYKQYGSLEVLKGIDIEIQAGEIVTIMGASGAGKTTLLQILSSLDKPTKGEVFVDGVEVHKLSGNKLSEFRNAKIGFVFQFHHLLPEFTALENVAMPALIKGLSLKEAKNQARDLLNMLNLSDRSEHKPSELSGGEQQRVAVARALVNKPAIIMADEPSGNLDSKNALELHNLFLNLRDELKQTFLIVTHNKDLSNISSRTLVMKDGVFV
ncbi:MAG: ABC transporter ATP-binding protein [Lentimicrobiaceae bacterium]|nr:ABC transporter ATP-binding protein [Lentimicrobiaceae bacterium]